MKPVPSIACRECGKAYEIPPNLVSTISTLRKVHPAAKITSFHCDECRESGYTADIENDPEEDVIE